MLPSISQHLLWVRRPCIVNWKHGTCHVRLVLSATMPNAHVHDDGSTRGTHQRHTAGWFKSRYVLPTSDRHHNCRVQIFPYKFIQILDLRQWKETKTQVLHFKASLQINQLCPSTLPALVTPTCFGVSSWVPGRKRGGPTLASISTMAK